jgi:hypothetical protein
MNDSAYEMSPDAVRAVYLENEPKSTPCIVAMLRGEPYNGAAVHGLVQDISTEERNGIFMHNAFSVTYFPSGLLCATTEYMNLATLCSKDFMCLHNALADGIGAYHREVAREQVRAAVKCTHDALNQAFFTPPAQDALLG